jgi:hypothetical protein
VLRPAAATTGSSSGSSCRSAAGLLLLRVRLRGLRLPVVLHRCVRRVLLLLLGLLLRLRC